MSGAAIGFTHEMADCHPLHGALQWRMPDDPFVREKFTKERSAARRAIREYFKRFPNKRYQTELVRWRHLQSQNFEFTMKRLREPIEADG